MLLGCRSLSSWVRRLVACMGSCLGCCGCAKPAPITAVDEPSKGLRIQGRSIRKANMSEDFWSTSMHEIENSAIQSQRSMSSLSTVPQSSDQHGARSSSNANEFVNQGLIRWNQTRQQWVGDKKNNSRSQQPQEPKISWNTTYESLLGSNKPFSQQIPLTEMVDLLVDAWEQEGLYGIFFGRLIGSDGSRCFCRSNGSRGVKQANFEEWVEPRFLDLQASAA